MLPEQPLGLIYPYYWGNTLRTLSDTLSIRRSFYFDGSVQCDFQIVLPISCVSFPGHHSLITCVHRSVFRQSLCSSLLSGTLLCKFWLSWTPQLQTLFPQLSKTGGLCFGTLSYHWDLETGCKVRHLQGFLVYFLSHKDHCLVLPVVQLS